MLRQGSEDSDTVEMEYCGKLHFALKFDSEMDALVVKVDTYNKVTRHSFLVFALTVLSRQRDLVPNYTPLPLWFALKYIIILIFLLTFTIDCQKITITGYNQQTSQPLRAHCGMLWDMGFKNWKKRREAVVLCTSCDFQRGDQASALGLGRMSTQRYPLANHSMCKAYVFGEQSALYIQGFPWKFSFQTLTSVSQLEPCGYIEDVHYWTQRGDNRSLFVS